MVRKFANYRHGRVQTPLAVTVTGRGFLSLFKDQSCTFSYERVGRTPVAVGMLHFENIELLKNLADFGQNRNLLQYKPLRGLKYIIYLRTLLRTGRRFGCWHPRTSSA